jgi:type IV secretion system protein VirB4
MVSDLLSHLHYCLTGVNQPVRVPPVPMYLDAILGREELVIDGDRLKLGDSHIEVMALDGYPLESWPGMLSRLDSLPLEYRFTVRFLFLDQWEAVQQVTRQRKGWQQQMTRFIDQMTNKPNPRLNRDAANMVEDAEQAEMDLKSGVVGTGYLTANIVLMHEDREMLAEVAREVRRFLRSAGFMPRIETTNSLEAWLSSHPGNSYANLRRPLINTMNMVDLLPLATTWTGLAHNPCPFYPAGSRSLAILTTDGSTPFRLNLHAGDVGHTLIFGPTGSGKSTLLALLAAQFRAYENASLFVFDKGLSMFALAKGAGGDHYDIGRDELSFAPLQHIDRDRDFAFATEWLAGVAELQKLIVLPPHRNAIHHALSILKANPEHMRSLTDFWHVLQDQDLKEALRHYTRAGAMGSLLDASTDNLQLSSFNCFEIEALMDMGEANLIPVLLYLFHRIEQRLTGQPALLILDEAWVMLGHPVFRAKLREWLKVLRRANCAVVMATQSITDAINSGIMDVLVESTPTKFLLANHEAGKETQVKHYQAMGLNSRQIEIIARMIPKRDYYLIQPSGRRRVQLALGPKTLAFAGVSGRDEISAIKTLIAKHPGNWQERWLHERGAA